MLTDFEYWILRRISSGEPRNNPGETAYTKKLELEGRLGPELLKRIGGKTVIDFGCGEGWESIGLARQGAGEVIGIDIREEVLEIARRNASAAGVAERCSFATSTSRLADFVISLDAFEHFADPAEVLRVMNALLKPEGEVVVWFGPPWFHPMGGHLFSVFPWAHLLFREEALIRWRATFKTDGATRFGEVAGGLNQMTIRKFAETVEGSPFRFISFEAVPIKRLRHFHNRLTREFTTAAVRCRLVKRAAQC